MDVPVLFVQNRVCARTFRAAKVLSDAGNPPVLLELDDPAPNIDYSVFARRLQVPVARDLRSMVLGRRRIVAALRDAVRDEGIQVVHTHNGPDNLGAWATKALDVPVVHDIHDMQTGAPIRFGKRVLRPVIAALYGAWERRACRKAAAVLVPSEQMAAHLRARYGNGRIHVIENKALPAAFDPLPKRSASGGTHFVYAGSLSPQPGSVRDFLPGFDRLAQGDVHVHVYPIVFDDDERQRVIDRIDQNPNLHYHPPVPHNELVRELSQYDYGLVHFPMMTDNLRMASATKLFEYVLAGIPVVANPEGRIGAFVEETHCGVTVDDLAEAPARLAAEGPFLLPRERCVLDADEFLALYQRVLGHAVHMARTSAATRDA